MALSRREEILCSIIADQFEVDVEKIVPTVRFIDDLRADSLTRVELLLAVQEEFNIKIPVMDAVNILSVQDAMDYINTHAVG